MVSEREVELLLGVVGRVQHDRHLLRGGEEHVTLRRRRSGAPARAPSRADRDVLADGVVLLDRRVAVADLEGGNFV